MQIDTKQPDKEYEHWTDTIKEDTRQTTLDLTIPYTTRLDNKTLDIKHKTLDTRQQTINYTTRH